VRSAEFGVQASACPRPRFEVQFSQKARSNHQFTVRIRPLRAPAVPLLSVSRPVKGFRSSGSGGSPAPCNRELPWLTGAQSRFSLSPGFNRVDGKARALSPTVSTVFLPGTEPN
jgi:hypothetical protein